MRRIGGMLAGALALAALGCGSSSPEVESGGTGGGQVRDLLTLLPADTIAVARVDMQAVRSSPYAPMVDRMVATFSEGQPGAAVADPLIDGIDHLVMGLTSRRDANGDLGAVIVARGHWPAGEVERLLRQPEPGAPPLREEQRGQYLVFIASDLAIIRLRADLWAATSPAEADAVIAAVGANGTAPVRSQPWFGSLAAQLGFDQATAAAVADLRALEQATGRRAEIGPGMEMVEQAQAMGLAASIQSGAAIRAILQMPSGDLATQAAAQLQIALAQLGDNMIVQMMGVAPILSRAEVTATGVNTTVATRAEDAEVRAVLQRLEGLAALASQMGGDGDEAGASGDVGVEEMPPPQAP